MDCIEALMTRRSIRSYTAEPVTAEEFDVVLRAAMAAPSAGNNQPWRFVVVTESSQREALSQATPYSGMIARAPMALVVCGDTREEKHPGFWVQDCSAAIENALLAAHAIGLGAVWIGVHPVVESVATVRSICGIPEAIEPMSMIALGHTDAEKPPGERFDPTYVHHERWAR